MVTDLSAHRSDNIAFSMAPKGPAGIPSFFKRRGLLLYNPLVGQRLSLRSEAATATQTTVCAWRIGIFAMSMIGNFLQVTPLELQALIDDPSAVEDFIYPEDEEHENCMDVDKAWHGIHFLLSGDPWGGNLPLANVVLGGTEIGDDVGYGPARYITADDVRTVADAISDVTPQELAKRYDPSALKKHEIYPEIWDEGEGAVEYLTSWYQSLREYYLDAASKGNAMLKYLN